MILLATAFGVTEAGLVDHSLFSLDHRGIESWDDIVGGTFIEPIGLSACPGLDFVGGHVIYSICAPIAPVEAFRPGRHRKPRLGLRALAVVALLYVAASVLVLLDHLTNESSHASGTQMMGSIAVIGILGLLVLVRSRRSAADRSERPVPRPRNVFLAGIVVALVYHLTTPVWVGFGIAAATVALAGVLIRRAARSSSWTVQDVVALAAAVLVRAVPAFTYFPLLGDVSAPRKYGHTVVLLVAMVIVSVLAARESSIPTASVRPRPDPG
jgi:hypothetical protein